MLHLQCLRSGDGFCFCPKKMERNTMCGVCASDLRGHVRRCLRMGCKTNGNKKSRERKQRTYSLLRWTTVFPGARIRSLRN